MEETLEDELPKHLIRPQYEELGDFMPDKYGQYKFVGIHKLIAKEHATKVHPH